MSVRATGAASENSAETYALKAKAVNPAALVVTSTAVTFTDTIAGATSFRDITITNGAGGDAANTRQDSGKLAVTLSNTTDFTVDTNTINSTCLNASGNYVSLPGGVATSHCTIQILFTPQTAGAKTLSISVSATPGGAPAPLSLTGNGLGALTVTPTSTAAAPIALSGTPLTTTLVVKNTSAKATQLLRETIGGTNASAFVIVSDTCYGQSLPAGDSCVVAVEFIGTVSTTTAQTATVTASDGTANNSVSAYVKAGGP